MKKLHQSGKEGTQIKKALSLVLLLAVVFSVSAQAAGPERIIRMTPSISFSGTTATCSVDVRGNTATDRISFVAKLWHGNTCLNTWTASGTGHATLNKTQSVTRGQTYKLTVDATINGEAQPTKSVTKTCP